MALISSIYQASAGTTIVTRQFNDLAIGGTTSLFSYYGSSSMDVIPTQDSSFSNMYYAVMNIIYSDSSQVQLSVIDANGNSYSTVLENWQIKINTDGGYLVAQCDSNGGNSDLAKQQINAYGTAIYFLIYLHNTFGNTKLTSNSTIKNIIFITNVNFNGIRMSYDSDNLVYFIGHSPSYPSPRLFTNSILICKMLAMHQLFANTSDTYPISVSMDYLAFMDGASDIYATLISNDILITQGVQSNFVFDNLGSDVILPYYINYPDLYATTYDNSLKDTTIELNSSGVDILNINQNQNDLIYRGNVNTILKSYYLYIAGSNGSKTNNNGQTFNMVSSMEQLGILPLPYDEVILTIFSGLFIANMLFTTPLYTDYNQTLITMFKLTEPLPTFVAAEFALTQSFGEYYDALIANFVETFTNMNAPPLDPTIINTILLNIRNACNFNNTNVVVVIDADDDLTYVLPVPEIQEKIKMEVGYYPVQSIFPVAIRIMQLSDIMNRLLTLRQKRISYIDIEKYEFNHGSEHFVVEQPLAKPNGISQVPA